MTITSNGVYHLTCEHRKNPQGIDITNPRLSWKLRGQQRGIYQTAYRITAAESSTDLDEQRWLLWDTGRVESDQSVLIPYAGPSLTSGQRVYWRVTVWDNYGNELQSESVWWEMGLLERSDWQAKWIGDSLVGGPFTTSPAPFLRREFTLTKHVAKARLYATALGVYECHLNGTKVGDDVLTPGWTDYRTRIQYQVYDVTGHLQPGGNVIGVILGDGWAVGHIAWVGRQNYADQPRLLAQLVITYEDGSQEIIATDSSWSVTTGPILESDLLMGESYDARRELTGWTSTGYDSSGWSPAQVFPDNGAALTATNGPTVRRQEELRAVEIHAHPDYVNPRWVFDFGQNMVGRVRLKVSGPAGTTVTIRHAEALNTDGTLYTANLRTARNTDFYTLKGNGEEVYEPHFVFHGFRYVELLGFPGKPDEDSVTGVVIHSDAPLTGSFECSDPLLNQLQSNILWSQKGNFIDVPTDCPQRDERLGWTGDAQVFARTAAFNMNVAGFFGKWLQDLEDAQYDNGTYPAIAPNPNAWSIPEGGPAWADAGVIVPWTLYQTYGDKRILEKYYGSMCRFIDFLAGTSRDHIRCYPDYEGWHGFGDWLALDGSDGREGGTSKELIGTAFFAYSTRLMSQIAGILGKEADQKQFGELSDKVRGAFIDRYVQADGTIVGGTQTSYVLALHFNLLPEDFRTTAAATLDRGIKGRDNHLSTGFVGTPYLNRVLTEVGYLDTAYDLLNQKTWPSWLYSVTQGATTIWERWDGWTHDKGFQDPGMNSFNHYAYGAIGAWLYAVVGGIDVDPDQPGYKHIIMRPQPGGGLTSARAEFESMYGTIHSTWRIEHKTFDWQITIPANTTATVFLPASKAADILESGSRAAGTEGISLAHRKDNVAVFRVQSGDYHFSAKL